MQTVPIPTPDHDDLELRLRAIADTLEVPQSAYTQATERYESVGRWLCADGSPLKEFNPKVFAQGSFALGTVIRPFNREDYDIDAVVQLNGSINTWTPKNLKEALGDRLRDHGTYAKMLGPEGRRCWTLTYASGEKEAGFHMDLLACVSHATTSDLYGVAGTQTAIAITNRIVPLLYDWRQSDPKGYAVWFKKRMAQRRTRDFTEKRASIEAVPEYASRSTLQVTVQLLKRHRDVMFEGRDEAPISVIISTLAARTYDGEPTLAETVVNVTKGMRKQIEVVGGRPFIRNPVRPEENFADRWEKEPEKQGAFFEWLSAAEKLAEDVAEAVEGELQGLLSANFGESIAEGAIKKYASRRSGIVRALADPRGVAAAPIALQSPTAPPTVMPAGVTLPAVWSAATHRQLPAWQERGDGTRLRISGRVTGGRGARLGSLKSGQLLSPESKLCFEADCDQRTGDSVYWQIVNTGRYAAQIGQLRGSFELGHGHCKVETALYPGNHFIEAFLVRGGVCVARSGPFIVKVG
jgi:hypothetical protein